VFATEMTPKKVISHDFCSRLWHFAPENGVYKNGCQIQLKGHISGLCARKGLHGVLKGMAGRVKQFVELLYRFMGHSEGRVGQVGAFWWAAILWGLEVLQSDFHT
jgi:hypothetical protein